MSWLRCGKELLNSAGLLSPSSPNDRSYPLTSPPVAPKSVRPDAVADSVHGLCVTSPINGHE